MAKRAVAVRGGDELPQELERMGVLLYERLDERDPALAQKQEALVERIAAITRAIAPVGIELGTKSIGDELLIVVFPQTSFRPWAEATAPSPKGEPEQGLSACS